MDEEIICNVALEMEPTLCRGITEDHEEQVRFSPRWWYNASQVLHSKNYVSCRHRRSTSKAGWELLRRKNRDLDFYRASSSYSSTVTNLAYLSAQHVTLKPEAIRVDSSYILDTLVALEWLKYQTQTLRCLLLCPLKDHQVHVDSTFQPREDKQTPFIQLSCIMKLQT